MARAGHRGAVARPVEQQHGGQQHHCRREEKDQVRLEAQAHRLHPLVSSFISSGVNSPVGVWPIMPW